MSFPDEFAKKFSYPLVPTNVMGAYALPPDTGDAGQPHTHALLEAAIGRSLLESDRIVPHIVPQPGVTHFRVGSDRASAASHNSHNWSGGEISGSFNAAVGSWIVPTVSQPTEPAGGGGGWHLSTWVGIDGDYGSNDVLQAGVAQSVNANGNVSAVCWYEWWSPFAKQTLSDTSPFSPSLASLNGRLYVAWTADGSQNLNIMYSSNNGKTFGNKYTSPETSAQSPVLAVHNGLLFVAWKGSADDYLNVAQVGLSGNAITGLVNKLTPGDMSPVSPALASANGRLYLAWKGDVNDNLNLMYSADNGNTFGGKFTSPETSPQSPTLAAHNGGLYIGWKGDGNDNLNVAQLNPAGNGFINKRILLDTSPLAPALASFNGALYLAWKGDGNDNLNLMYSTDNGNSFGGKYVSSETSSNNPAIVAHGAHLFYGWRGDAGNNSLYVSVVGLDAGAITGWTTPAYRSQANIANLPVKPGDSVACAVAYIINNTAGALTFVNLTSGQYFTIVLVPPPGASFSGNCSEWIGETPGYANGLSSLAKFTDIVFSNCFCHSPAGAISGPQNGDTITIVRSGQSLTGETVTANSVRIKFQG